MGNVIMGVDPGIALTGWGLIEDMGGNNYRRVNSGCIKTDKNLEHMERLKVIHSSIVDVIWQYQPSAFALENVFFNKNTRTALMVGEARGVIMLGAALSEISVFHYTPLQVKSSVSGDGRADKLQMQKMVGILLRLNDFFKYDDEADALAVALCHLQHMKMAF